MRNPPPSICSCVSATVGMLEKSLPPPKSASAAACARSAASVPCTCSVSVKASVRLASLMAAPRSAPRRRTSSIGKNVSSARQRSTSASSTLRQYW